MDIYFFGTFNCKADAKGRIMLPVALRNQVAPILKDGFFIKKSYLSELEIWDKKAYDQSISATKEEKVKLAKRVMLGEKSEGDVS